MVPDESVQFIDFKSKSILKSKPQTVGSSHGNTRLRNICHQLQVVRVRVREEVIRALKLFFPLERRIGSLMCSILQEHKTTKTPRTEQSSTRCNSTGRAWRPTSWVGTTGGEAHAGSHDAAVRLNSGSQRMRLCRTMTRHICKWMEDSGGPRTNDLQQTGETAGALNVAVSKLASS